MGEENYPAIEIEEGARMSGFRVTRVLPVPDLRSVAYRAVHERSGAEVLHLHTDDRENLFAIGFRTPPPDNTGLPHILEHTVLCGSKKYPVKDPFAALLKTSLATFLNAMTYPDRTIYPCASMNRKDLFNLIDVYCDAVFNPRLLPDHFAQEGHHLEFLVPGDISSPLRIKGVVYNEMKGVYSDLDGRIGREISASLFPDNAYGRDYGGDPRWIPSLSYDRFLEFYRRSYHPSNALIFIYGNIPPARYLDYLDSSRLDRFRRKDYHDTIPACPPLNGPVEKRLFYPIGLQENPAKKTAVAAAWRAGVNTDPVKTLSLHLLSYYLLANAASPLRRALIDSGLGEELTESGYFSYQRDTYFTAGLKGTEPSRADEIYSRIEETIAGIAARGLEAEKMESAFHHLELSSKEVKSLYPLRLMDRAFEAWASGGEPTLWLELNRYIDKVRARFQREPGYFQNLLEETFIKNSDRVLLTFIPSPDAAAEEEKEERDRLVKVREKMSPEELTAAARRADDIRRAQSTPNTAAELATLPRLHRDDVPPDPVTLNTTRRLVGGKPFLVTDIFSNGLSYLDIAFNLSGLSRELIPYLPLYALAVEKMGAGEYDYLAMAEREDACSGGVATGLTVAGPAARPERADIYFTVDAGCLHHNLGRMLELLSLKLTEPDFDDISRLRNIILQERIAGRSGILRRGNSYAARRAAAHLSSPARMNEEIKGVSRIRFLDRLAEEVENDPGRLTDRLKTIAGYVNNSAFPALSVVGVREGVGMMEDWFASLVPGRATPEAARDWRRSAPGVKREGLSIPSRVAFSGAALPAVSYLHPLAPALLLLGQQLSYGYLWDEIRVKGGAYGCRGAYNPAFGQFVFSSYRDPGIAGTINIFGRVGEYIEKEMDLSPAVVEQAVIGAVRNLDYPIRPPQASGLALFRFIRGQDPGVRKEFRRRLLSLGREELLRACREVLAPGLVDPPLCVIGGGEMLEEANRVLEEKLVIRDL